MRKETRKTYPTKTINNWFRHELTGSEMCTELVRDCFDLGRTKSCDFVVTDRKPKGDNFHRLYKPEGNAIWRVTSAPDSNWYGLMDAANRTLSSDFPGRKTLYVSVNA